MATKKISITILFLQLTILTVFAQKDKGFGLKGGTSHYTYIVDNQDELGYNEFGKSFRHGMFISFFYDGYVGPVGLRTEINITQKGAITNHLRTLPIGIDDELKIYTDENIRLGYLELAVLGRQTGYEGEKLKWDIFFGPSIGYAMIGIMKWDERKEYPGGSMLEESFDDLIKFDKEDYRRLDIGFNLSSELRYHITDQWAIILDTRYQINLTKRKGTAEGGKIRNHGFGMLLGLRKSIWNNK